MLCALKILKIQVVLVKASPHRPPSVCLHICGPSSPLSQWWSVPRRILQLFPDLHGRTELDRSSAAVFEPWRGFSKSPERGSSQPAGPQCHTVSFQSEKTHFFFLATFTKDQIQNVIHVLTKVWSRSGFGMDVCRVLVLNILKGPWHFGWEEETHLWSRSM